MPKAACAATTLAPVWPALNSAAAWPAATCSAATRIDARGLRRSAFAGDSLMSITSGASMTRTSRSLASGWRAELGANQVRAADEVDTEPEIARGRDGAINGMRRRMIAAHRVNRYAHADRVKLIGGSFESVDSVFVDGTDLARAIVAAVRAHAVRGLRLAALRAQAGGGGRQRVVRAALAAAGLGVSDVLD